MSNYSIGEIENLINCCNKSNKKIIVNTIKQIIEEDHPAFKIIRYYYFKLN